MGTWDNSQATPTGDRARVFVATFAAAVAASRPRSCRLATSSWHPRYIFLAAAEGFKKLAPPCRLGCGPVRQCVFHAGSRADRVQGHVFLRSVGTWRGRRAQAGSRSRPKGDAAAWALHGCPPQSTSWTPAASHPVDLLQRHRRCTFGSRRRTIYTSSVALEAAEATAEGSGSETKGPVPTTKPRAQSCAGSSRLCILSRTALMLLRQHTSYVHQQRIVGRLLS
ncbi:hypothetical protein MTO96_031896 [Rhipicephalus appendiculatus]